MRVVAALSGGVDSAVAAARALDAGHEVTGVHLLLATPPGSVADAAPPGSAAADAVPPGSAAD
ncbi:MAG: tRNA-specific 2-thiouridylase, partial [Actinomycetia bacterium]|nr:tRNA-specific 2-thiouridylase [Actinomycetes bacterium]